MNKFIRVTKKKSRHYYNNHCYTVNRIGFDVYRFQKGNMREEYNNTASINSISKDIFPLSPYSGLIRYHYPFKIICKENKLIEYYTTYVFSFSALKRKLNQSTRHRINNLGSKVRIYNL